MSITIVKNPCASEGSAESYRGGYDFIVCSTGAAGCTLAEMQILVRVSACTYRHQACTAKTGRDEMSVVDGQLKVHGIDRLRIADSSIVPNITSGNTIAPCVVIGERAAEIITSAHRI